MVEQDYVMRLIHEMIRTLIKLIFQADEEKEEIQITDEAVKEKYESLLELADRGQINEAENLLFEDLDREDTQQLLAGLLFYRHINDFSDGALEQADYSREEIKDGVEMLLEKFGLNEMAEMVLL